MLTKSITKLLKKSARVICQPDESGVIYITDGHLLAVVTPEEYTKFIRPATQRPAGDFEIRDGQETPRTVDVKRLFSDHLRHLDASAPLEFAPVTFRADRLEIAATYCREKDFVSIFDRALTACFDSVSFRAADAKSPALLIADDVPVGLILPIRPQPSISRAARAYFDAPDAPAAQDAQAQIDSLRAQVAQLEAVCKAKAQQADQWHDAFQAQEQRAAALQGQLEHTKANMAAVVEDKSRLARQLEAVQAATVGAAPQPTPKPAATLAENLSRIPGATVKIAGENSRAPVIWITAADPDAAEAIRRAGGRWAEKKSAFYISVA